MHGKKRNAYIILLEILKERGHLEHRHKSEDKIKWNLGKSGIEVQTEFIWFRIGVSCGFL
jgi:hypothetical protein